MLMGGALSDVLNAILDAIPESGVMPEPKYDLTNVESDMDENAFATALGISVDKLPDFFKESVVKYGSATLTRVYYDILPESGGTSYNYTSVWGGTTQDYGATLSINLHDHRVKTDYTEV